MSQRDDNNKTREIKAVVPDEKTRKMENPDVTREIPVVAKGLPEAKLRLRMSAHDAHYGGQLVDGARMLGLFGDVATELLIRLDGDEGLFRAYDQVEFLAPVHAGDYIEASGRVVETGKSSRRMVFEAWKVITPRPDLSDSAAELLSAPVLVCRASGTCVVPAAKQRYK
jgi:3-aminobutyryl-CoA ammonia-lyase